MNQSNVEILSFSNRTRTEKKLLKEFVDFHWRHYADDPQYVPLLDYEYLGFKLIGIHGFFEPDNLFLKHADMQFFLALRDGKVVGRCNAFINHRHNTHWHDKVGFFGQYEVIDDQQITDKLTEATSEWLLNGGMDTIRGPQNLPVNEATPGILTEGFNSRPVMYYHYNKPFYAHHLAQAGFSPVKRVLSWEYDVPKPFGDKFEKLVQNIVDRYDIRTETWDQRPFSVRKREMLEIYNAAWNDNWGFVPFTEEEFGTIVNDMTLILDKGLFIFLYIRDEPVAFFGGVPNITEFLGRIGKCRHCELIRAVRMILNRKRTKGFRLGYLGIKPEYRRMGLDAVMLLKQWEYANRKGYVYSDLGWVLEDNKMAIRMVERVGPTPSKVYTIYEKVIA
ncbi:hypothetical protein JW824_06550 [bacterium]|nr:hypothetical protein [bacterium]RQV95531.1 MAG: hypothetical protein EH221_06040 [bacterium]